MKRSVIVSIALLVSMMGCGDDTEQATRRGLGGGDSSGDSASAEASPMAGDSEELVEDGDTEGEGGTRGALNYDDEIFVAADIQNRDPFRDFAASFVSRPPARLQRRVVLSEVSVDEMRLSMIVTGTAPNRAMVVAPDGVGHVIKRGDYIGRPEVIQSNSVDAVPVTLNWRVERIRPHEVVLTREDPTDRDRPPLTRVMPLHEEGDLMHPEHSLMLSSL